jgi:hypothetical protein
VNIAGAT